MAILTETLREEHRGLERLLAALERQIAVFADGGTPDYDVVRSLVDYLLDYPERCHHPKEDVVYARLLRTHPMRAATVLDLLRDHQDLAYSAQLFARAVDALLGDTDIPRAVVVDSARSFVKAERDHMRREEELIFPFADRLLTEADWQWIETEIEQRRMTEATTRAERELGRIRDQLLTWDLESASASARG